MKKKEVILHGLSSNSRSSHCDSGYIGYLLLSTFGYNIEDIFKGSYIELKNRIQHEINTRCRKSARK